MWKPEKIEPLGPVYVAIADALERDIESGRLRSGERLPTHRELARMLGVNVVTVTRAYAEASRRGLVEGEVGRGTFVREKEHWDLEFPGPPEEEPDGVIDFNFNVPVGDPSILEVERVLKDIAEDPDHMRLFAGYLPAGMPEHREAGAEWIGRSGLTADPERVVVCNGTQHALAVTLAALLEPGDVLLTEELTYPGIKALASMQRVRLLPLALDEDGLVPEAFEAACKKGASKVLYCVPTLQNPTGTVLPEERRRAIAELARRYGVTIIEDLMPGFLCPDPPPPLSGFAPERCYTMASTTKSIAPGLRIGYVMAPVTEGPPSSATDRLIANVAATIWNPPLLMAELATRWIRSGAADRMVAWKRKETAARRLIFQRFLGRFATPSHPSSAHVWLPLPPPWRGEDFVAEALRRGVAVTPAEHFVIGRATAPHAVRLSLARPPVRAEVERGLELLARILQGVPRVRRSIV